MRRRLCSTIGYYKRRRWCCRPQEPRRRYFHGSHAGGCRVQNIAGIIFAIDGVGADVDIGVGVAIKEDAIAVEYHTGV